MTRTECVDYRELPGQNALFLDFLYRFDRVKTFYGPPVHTGIDVLTERAEVLLKSPPRFSRDRMAAILAEFNTGIGASERSIENAARLRSPQCLAIVTGQQPGFLGGAALSVYKAMTAVRLAGLLEAAGYSVVPIFWLASDDSDFQEVQSTTFFQPAGSPLTVSYPDLRSDPAQMIGTVGLEQVGESLGAIEETGIKGDSFRLVLEALRDCYAPGRTFREAMGAWLSRIFSSHGLVVFDPLSEQYKEGLGEFFSVAVDQRERIVQSLQERARDLASGGFEAQVRVESSESFLFWTEGEKRFKLEREGGRVRAKGSPPSLPNGIGAGAEFLEHFVHLSPNVLLRPILQDWLFPTVAYVGGPSEVAYFAQVNAISSFWDQTSAIFPRVGITMVDRRAQRLLEKHGLGVLDILRGGFEEVYERVLRENDPAGVLGRLEEIQGRVKSGLASLKADMEQVDPTIVDMVKGAEGKILYQLDKIQNRFVSNRKRDEVTLTGQLDYLSSRLYPDGTLQERVINFGQFMSEEGVGLVDALVAGLDPFCPGHQLVYV